jgi:1-acyl-sn-glycerol-3-phosphate acyltransferase
VIGWGLRKIGQIPIRRGFGDWDAIETSADVLRRGLLAGIAPEGTVGDGAQLGHGQKGAARIALMAGAPISPVGLWCTNMRWPKSGLTLSAPVRPRVSVVVGEPLQAVGDPRCRLNVQSLTDTMMNAIGSLVAEARRRSNLANGFAAHRRR